jgi:hypothetical protein
MRLRKESSPIEKKIVHRWPEKESGIQAEFR